MGTPVVDSKHLATEDLVEKLTNLFFSSEFKNLCAELEHLYRRTGNEKPTRQAFQDALYTLMVQEEIDLNRAKLLE